MPCSMRVPGRAVLLVCAALLALPSASPGQQTPVQPGTRVRLLAPSTADSLVTGTVVAIDSASLLLAVGFDTAGVHVPLAAIRQLEVEADPRDTAQRGGLWGMLAGAGAAYLVLSPCSSPTDGCGSYRALGTAAGAVAGMLVGRRIGGATARGRWRFVPVYPPPPADPPAP